MNTILASGVSVRVTNTPTSIEYRFGGSCSAREAFYCKATKFIRIMYEDGSSLDKDACNMSASEIAKYLDEHKL